MLKIKDEVKIYNDEQEKIKELSKERKRQVYTKFLRRIAEKEINEIAKEEIINNNYKIENKIIYKLINVYFENKKINNSINQEVLKRTEEKRKECTKLKSELQHQKFEYERLIMHNEWKEEKLKEYNEKESKLKEIKELEFKNKTLLYGELNRIYYCFKEKTDNEIARYVEKYDIENERNLGYLIGLRKSKKELEQLINDAIEKNNISNKVFHYRYNREKDIVEEYFNL